MLPMGSSDSVMERQEIKPLSLRVVIVVVDVLAGNTFVVIC